VTVGVGVIVGDEVGVTGKVKVGVAEASGRLVAVGALPVNVGVRLLVPGVDVCWIVAVKIGYGGGLESTAVGTGVPSPG
jgi:hypothetical protein